MPAGRRRFVRMDVNMPSHKKLAPLRDPGACWTAAVGIMQSHRLEQDGFVVPGAVTNEAGTTKSKGDKLIRANVWHAPGHDCARCPQPPEGQVVIHDYLDWQESAEQLQALSDKRRTSGAKGGQSTAVKNGKPRGKQSASATASARPNEQQPGSKPAPDEEEDISTQVDQSPPETYENGERPPTGASGPTSAQAHRLIRHTLGRNLPAATLTALSIPAAQLLAQYDEPTVVEALSDWNSRTGIGPNVLFSCAADVVKRRNGATAHRPARPSTADARLADIQALKTAEPPQLPPGGQP